MTHLSPAEFVDLIDGALPPSREAHVESCADCRSQAAALQSVLRDAARIAVPDPSPFFWDRLSARIRASVAESAPVSGIRRVVPLASAAALIVALVGGAWLARNAGAPPPAVRVVPTPAVERPRAMLDESALDAANGEVWDVLTSVAADMAIDEAAAAGMTVHPAAIDGAVQKMSPDERKELARLLQSELKHSSN
jgi:hypothetical protein